MWRECAGCGGVFYLESPLGYLIIIKFLYYRLAIYDGVEVVAYLIGSALSKSIFNWGGYYLSYITTASLSLIAFLYLTFFIPESRVIQKEEKEEEKGESEKEGCCTKVLISNSLYKTRREDKNFQD